MPKKPLSPGIGAAIVIFLASITGYCVIGFGDDPGTPPLAHHPSPPNAEQELGIIPPAGAAPPVP